MNLEEFHANVSTSLNRGTSLDSRIPARVKQAVQWIERNYNFKYMEQFRLLQIAKDDRTIKLNSYIKSWKFIRLIGTDSTYSYLNKIEPQDAIALATDIGAYWIVGNSVLVLNAVPTEVLSGEAMWIGYTDWPVEPASRHFLLDVASDVVLAQTLMFMATFDTKDPRMLAEYKGIRDEGLNTLTRSADEEQYGGAGVSMAFTP